MRMRSIVPHVIPRLLVAAILAVGATALVEHVGPVAVTILLFVLLVAALYVATLLVPRALAGRRARRRYRGSWRGPRWWPFRRNGGNGGGFGGVREPRRPRPPFLPPRAAAAEPDSVSQER